MLRYKIYFIFVLSLFFFLFSRLPSLAEQCNSIFSALEYKKKEKQRIIKEIAQLKNKIPVIQDAYHQTLNYEEKMKRIFKSNVIKQTLYLGYQTFKEVKPLIGSGGKFEEIADWCMGKAADALSSQIGNKAPSYYVDPIGTAKGEFENSLYGKGYYNVRIKGVQSAAKDFVKEVRVLMKYQKISLDALRSYAMKVNNTSQESAKNFKETTLVLMRGKLLVEKAKEARKALYKMKGVFAKTIENFKKDLATLDKEISTLENKLNNCLKKAREKKEKQEKEILSKKITKISYKANNKLPQGIGEEKILKRERAKCIGIAKKIKSKIDYADKIFSKIYNDFYNFPKKFFKEFSEIFNTNPDTSNLPTIDAMIEAIRYNADVKYPKIVSLFESFKSSMLDLETRYKNDYLPVVKEILKMIASYSYCNQSPINVFIGSYKVDKNFEYKMLKINLSLEKDIYDGISIGLNYYFDKKNYILPSDSVSRAISNLEKIKSLIISNYKKFLVKRTQYVNLQKDICKIVHDGENYINQLFNKKIANYRSMGVTLNAKWVQKQLEDCNYDIQTFISKISSIAINLNSYLDRVDNYNNQLKILYKEMSIAQQQTIIARYRIEDAVKKVIYPKPFYVCDLPLENDRIKSLVWHINSLITKITSHTTFARKQVYDSLKDIYKEISKLNNTEDFEKAIKLFSRASKIYATEEKWIKNIYGLIFFEKDEFRVLFDKIKDKFKILSNMVNEKYRKENEKKLKEISSLLAKLKKEINEKLCFNDNDQQLYQQKLSELRNRFLKININDNKIFAMIQNINDLIFEKSQKRCDDFDAEKIKNFYTEKFKIAYENKDLSQLLTYISDDWASSSDGSSIDDLEEYLNNSFNVFDEIQFNISSLTVQKLPNGNYRVDYVTKITGYIYDDDIKHIEKSSVSEEVSVNGEQIKIIKTYSGRFWYKK